MILYIYMYLIHLRIVSQWSVVQFALYPSGGSFYIVIVRYELNYYDIW